MINKKYFFILLIIFNFNIKADIFSDATDYVKNKLDPLNIIKDAVSNIYFDSRAANVTNGGLSEREIYSTTQRFNVIRPNLESFLGINLLDRFNIAMCASGGGYRAMIFALGGMDGAELINLKSVYMSGLSGGTWALGSWISSGETIDTLKQSISQSLANNRMVGSLGSPVPSKFSDLNQNNVFIENLFKKYLFQQTIGSIDFWGAIIVNNLLEKQNLKLSDQAANVQTGQSLFPIYTAIDANNNNLNYTWHEFTPFDVRNVVTDEYIPVWSLGRTFSNGSSVDNAPEQSLGLYLGTFGSAFTISPEEMLNMQDPNAINNFYNYLATAITAPLNKIPGVNLSNSDIASGIKKLFTATIPITEVLMPGFSPNEIANMRLYPSELRNFSTKAQFFQNLILVDAGIDFNLPTPPLLKSERNIHAIIIFDASANVRTTADFQKAQAYAKLHGLKFPTITDDDFKNVGNDSINIFMDKNDKDVPLVIYVPNLKDPVFAKDASFNEMIKQYTDPKDPNYLPGCFTLTELQSLKNFDTEECTSNGECSTFN